MDRIRHLVLATSILVPASSEATVLLSNLAEPTRDTSNISLEQWAAQAFTTDGGSYTLTSISVLLGILSESPTIVAGIHADGGASGPGALLSTFLVPPIPATDPALQVLTPISAVALAPNTTYWVVFGAMGSGSYGWSYAEGNNSVGPGAFGSYAYSLDVGATWENFGSENPYKMEVVVSEASGVPEPASGLLLLAGLGAALARTMRRGRA